MTDTIVNLLIAIFLLTADAFYVAAEFALVKSWGFRINAMVEQNRFVAGLLQQMMGNVEAYLACCQLGVTMASLGLGWLGEPTVAALLEPVWGRSGCRTRRAILHRFWSVPRAFLAAYCNRGTGAEDPRHSGTGAGRAMDRLPALRLVSCSTR